MGRAEMVRRLLAYEAAVSAIKGALKAEGQLEHEENGASASWKYPYANVVGSTSQDHVEVTDEDEFLTWFFATYPTEAEKKTVIVVRNPGWMDALRADLATASRRHYDRAQEEAEKDAEEAAHADAIPEHVEAIVVDADGTVVPGLQFVPGGRFLTVSTTPSHPARLRARKAALHGVHTGDWSRLERAIKDPRYLTREEPDTATGAGS